MAAKAIAILVLLATLSSHTLALNVLYARQVLNQGESLTAGSYRLTMQTDCNLVLYNGGNRAIWASGTNGKGTVCRAAIQRDSNFVVYSGDNRALWASGTVRSDDNYRVVMQTDGNVVVYTPGGQALWATHTVGRARKLL